MAKLGRPREFDTNEAIDRAMDVFWARGYEATSLADLMDAMGLQKGSIYKAFKDKRTLYLLALERYLDRTLDGLVGAVAAAEGPWEALKAAVDALVTALISPDNRRRGCFGSNTLVELARHDPEVARRVVAWIDRQRAVLQAVVQRGQSAGVVRADVPPSDLAELIVSLVPGVIARSKAQDDRPCGDQALSALLALLKPGLKG